MKEGQSVSGGFFDPIKGIYKITNTATGRVYIGQSIELQGRLASHFKGLGMGRHAISLMQSDWNEYGPESFTAEVLERVSDKDTRLIREAEIIAEAIGRGTDIYNGSIPDPDSIRSNVEARRVAKIAQQEAEAALSLKKQVQVKENGQEETRGHHSPKKTATRKNDIFRSGAISGPESLPSLAGNQQELRVEEADIRPVAEGVNRAAETKRPPTEGMDANGQPRKGNENASETLPASDDYNENELGEYVGYENVTDLQWEIDSKFIIESIEDQENTPTTLEWFLRTYIKHSIIKEIAGDLDTPLIYVNPNNPAQVARQITKYLPDYELVKKE